MRHSFYGNLNDYYHEYHSVGNSFNDHDRDHVLIHVHMVGTIFHSLQGMVWTQLDKTSNFSSKVHYFVQQ